MKETAPHWFPPSSGSGAGGADEKGHTKPNPFIRGVHFNLTEQARIKKENEPLYDRLKAEAARAKAA